MPTLLTADWLRHRATGARRARSQRSCRSWACAWRWVAARLAHPGQVPLGACLWGRATAHARTPDSGTRRACGRSRMRRTARQQARRAPSARRTPQASCWHGAWAGPFGRGTQISGRGPRTQARHGRVLQSPIGKHSRAYDRLESDVRSARRTCPIPTPTHPLRSSCLSTGHAAHEWLGPV